MSKSKAVNKFNFYLIFLLSLFTAFVTGLMHNTNGLRTLGQLNGIEIAGLIGYMLSCMTYLFGLPLLIAFLVAKFTSKPPINLSYTLVWLLFCFFSLGTWPNMLPSS